MGRRGFSLLEVMVAVGIFGLAVTAILAAEADSVRANRRSHSLGTAVSLGRCKMTEVEERLMKLGYSENDESESGVSCCDEKDHGGITCDWKAERVTLPEANAIGPDAGVGGASLDLAAGLGGADGGLSGPLGGAALNFDGGMGALSGQLSSMGGAQGMLSMVFSIVYPSLKPLLENSIRRISVTVKWKEGEKERDLLLMQYVTNPARSGLQSGALVDGGAIAPTPTSPTSPAATGTGTTAPNTAIR